MYTVSKHVVTNALGMYGKARAPQLDVTLLSYICARLSYKSASLIKKYQYENFRSSHNQREDLEAVLWL